ncbi:unnamed protein product [Penicillium salamii]|uniref:Xylanolytic transcriptional activator regulatory domain-containing protein n=1 Tax=Penicillium salamii TaxID=1612424 RepID=A0A9W4NL39_9EURO|nr:unnamed protein product [Penicillium salamii]CAG8074016.1 unnamed protein product [Penicillium salamii]CAG8173660.1 unnamed protein product [Penicillium salamii]CAG8226619.1 unnamed protein product [Penicillium salamii]CAG8310802.1 unnamed protein product [Penicillium salamii]
MRLKTHSVENSGPQTQSAKEIQMQRIIKHFAGDISFETSDLKELADKLTQDDDRDYPDSDSTESHIDTPTNDYSIDTLSTSTMHYSGELSHWNFSRMLERRLRSLGDQAGQRKGVDHTQGFFRATDLQSSGSCITLARTYFPPKHIAEFLTNAFMKFSETNYFYFHEATFREKLNFYYTNERPLTINDAGWICTLLMTFAIGTQFAHMHAKATSSSENPVEMIPDDQIGLELYRYSCRLIPDLITVASVETVQAFLLLGVYTFPIDTAGLAYVYYGLAIKMAIQNGMHRRLIEGNIPAEIIEVRNRLWWSAHSLESRIGILHGRPVSVSPSDIDAPMPVDIPALRPTDQYTNLPNFTAAIVLTNHLAKASEVMKSLRHFQKPNKKKYLRQLAALRSRLSSWWDSLPTTIHCRDLAPDGKFFRCNVHLEIYYTTTLIFMGRPFIISQSATGTTYAEPGSPTHEVPEIVNILRRDSFHAAVRVIELCQLLHDSVGLARVSYTEFNGCRVALLALIAHSMNEPTLKISSTLTQGMGLIRQICTGLESARSEVAVIEALERARQRLHNHTAEEKGENTDDVTGYDQFKEWAKLWRGDLMDGTDLLPLDDVDLQFEEQPHDSIPPFDGFLSSFPNELGEFAAIPGLSYDLSLAHNWLDNPHTEDSGWTIDHSL